MNVVKQKDSMNNSEIRRKITMLRTIKKYPNRRLYDTKESRYITLKYIKKLVVENEELIIQDVKSKKDITKVILSHQKTKHSRQILINMSGNYFNHPIHIFFSKIMISGKIHTPNAQTVTNFILR